MEEKRLSDQYKYLNLYCNWICHTRLSNSNTGYLLIEDIFNAVIKNFHTPPNLQFEKEIYNCINENSLKTDFSQFCKKNGIRSILFEDINKWKQFYIATLHII
jgi:hypothetical protein